MTKKKEPILPFESDEPDKGSIEALANYLPLDDLAKLIEIKRGRIIVFNQSTSTLDELSKELSVCMNGSCIQLTVNDEQPLSEEVEEILNG